MAGRRVDILGPSLRPPASELLLRSGARAGENPSPYAQANAIARLAGARALQVERRLTSGYRGRGPRRSPPVRLSTPMQSRVGAIGVSPRTAG